MTVEERYDQPPPEDAVKGDRCRWFFVRDTATEDRLRAALTDHLTDLEGLAKEIRDRHEWDINVVEGWITSTLSNIRDEYADVLSPVAGEEG